MQGLVNFKICISILLFGVIYLGSCTDIPESESFGSILGRILKGNKKKPGYKSAVINRDEKEFNISDKNIGLYLEPSDGILFTNETKLYHLYTNKSNPNHIFLKYNETMFNRNPKLFKNPNSPSLLSVNNGKIDWGYNNLKNSVICPVPEQLAKDVERYARLANGKDKSKLEDHPYHIVNEKNTSRIMEPFVNSEKTERATDYIIYPQIFVVVESSYFNLFNGSIEDFLIYSMAFWNGVDMLFRPIENPKIRLNIAGIIIVEDDNAFTYMKDSQNKNGTIDLEGALEQSESWLYEIFNSLSIKKNEYDMVVILTSLYGERKAGGQVAGAATMNSACENGHSRKIRGAIISDNGGLIGIKAAAHELAHALGADHDGKNGCDDNGQMMTPSEKLAPNAVTWSSCTLSDFEIFFNDNKDCLSNKPKGISLMRILPGILQNATEQCMKRSRGSVSKINDETCYHLSCISSEKHISISSEKSIQATQLILSGGAADGTSCGSNKICLHGQCISESLITGYSFV